MSLVALASAIVVGIILPPPPRMATQLVEGQVSFDLCFMWEQMSVGRKVGGAVFLIALLYFTWHGLHNRPGAEWFAIVGFLAVVQAALADAWRVNAGCYSQPSVITQAAWLMSLCALFVQHAWIWRTARGGEAPRTSWFSRLFRIGLVGVLMFSILAEAIGLVVGSRASEGTMRVLRLLSEGSSWLALAATLLGIAVGARSLYRKLESA
ncbi:MAG: hypothetical protein JNK87_21965 [Bryobacterales bacterium]|nr:hypothetical protein [Bryobacterales bacterium]